MNNNFKETLWKAADKLRNQMDAAEYKHIVLGLIFLKYISDSFEEQREKIIKSFSDPSSDYFISEDLSDSDYESELEDRDYYTQDNVFWVPKEARWETLRSQAKQPDIGSLIDSAMVLIENENQSLQGKLDKRFGRSQLEEGMMGELIDLISTIGFTDDQKAGDILGEVYEYFLGEFAKAEGQKGGQFYTTTWIVQLLVEVLSPYKGRVYDPCCGSGGMFVQSQKFVTAHDGNKDDISIYGQESNPTTWRLAAMNMAIRGIAADLGKEHADTFGRDQFPDQKFDYILANPHFNDSDWGGEKYENDPRWVYGRPPSGNANYAWLQHILWKLTHEGRAGVVLSNASMSTATGGEDKIRQAMIEGGVVGIMVALPTQLFANVTVPACLWFLDKNKSHRNDQILFIDARKFGTMIDRAHKKLTDEDISKIADTVNSWRKGEAYEDILGFCKSASIDEVKKNNYILTPGRYVGLVEEEDDGESFDEKMKKLTKELKDLQNKSQELDSKILENFKNIGFD